MGVWVAPVESGGVGVEVAGIASPPAVSSSGKLTRTDSGFSGAVANSAENILHQTTALLNWETSVPDGIS